MATERRLTDRIRSFHLPDELPTTIQRIAVRGRCDRGPDAAGRSELYGIETVRGVRVVPETDEPLYGVEILVDRTVVEAGSVGVVAERAPV
ncbi:hypothetical protein Halar_1824 [halophilic archaeon DL31]|nr:hypothetical protein Halar_1824 [halophilic archaeon DL31]